MSGSPLSLNSLSPPRRRVTRAPVSRAIRHDKMFLIFGSVLTLLASILLYCRPRKSWTVIGMEIIYLWRYNALAVKELTIDWINAKRNRTDLPLQSDKVAVITGGSRGIGFMVTKMLLQCDMEVIVACRKPEAGEKAIRTIRESGVATGRAKVYKLDNASFESVRQFVEQIKKDYVKINILINNAGIMFTPYGETEDGFEQQWSVNYLSHFLLTSLLLPLLKAGSTSGSSSRVINMSSCAHLLGNIKFDDINNKQAYIPYFAYAQSKLAQVIFTKKLQQLLSERNMNVKVYSVHPGIVNTDIFEHSYINACQWIVGSLFKTPMQGATSVVYAAVNKNVESQGGIYISNCQESPVHPLALDPLVQDRLFKMSLEQVELKDFFQYA